jgi:hypothetical protein
MQLSKRPARMERFAADRRERERTEGGRLAA